jgi:outer membrane protein OmpA-like peptidoglycan-associated protein/outer membrane protein W
MKLRNALLTATIIAAPFALSHAAHAQPVTGPYVGLGGGYNLEEAQKAKNLYVDGVGGTQNGLPDSAKITVHNGYTAEASVGYGFGNGFRVELEGDYYNNRFDKFKAAPGGGGASGAEQKYGAFANVLYDFDVSLPWMYPYAGAGVGYQFDNFNSFSGGNFDINKTKGSLAYQGIAGVAFPIAPVPGLSLTVEYRFMGLAGSRKFNGGYPVAGGDLPATFKVTHEYNNSIMAGVRYAFDTAPPPAPAPAPAPMAAAPAPAPAKTYLVFFDWDKSNLTPRATQIIAQAAADSKTQSVTTIAVNGYTDTSGTAVYNQGLSVRRAKAVESQLVADGVPESEITAQGFGDTHLLVPTGPGVREPQNRRVEIVFQ